MPPPAAPEPRAAPPTGSASSPAALAFLRRRLTGDYEVDDFGFDPDLTDHVLLPLLRPLYEKWFRVETRGLENIPDDGGALVVANHSGTVPLDALMTQLALLRPPPGAPPPAAARRRPGLHAAGRRAAGPQGRATRWPATRTPSGCCRRGELVGVLPEGFKGIGKPFSERYKLQRFGRGGFVSAALRTGHADHPVLDRRAPRRSTR